MKRGDISLETVVKLVIALAVLLVVIGIFGFQSRKGSNSINEVGDSAVDGQKSQLCIGSDVECISSCESDADSVAKTCLTPMTVCCKKSTATE